MYKVAVIMSTYNGEKYLKEQIDSILAQNNVDVTIYIRDDGSSDRTVDIIKEYMETHDNFRLFIGKNMGVGNSFMQVLYSVDKNNDYYAFADQDDVWLSDKIEKAIEGIKDLEKPALYCSNQILVDGKLNRIGMRYISNPDVSYRQIVCQNKISGCTMVWNKELHGFLSKNEFRPSEDLLRKRIHDVWVAMVASVVGMIKYDIHGYILYRQHESNVVGVKKTNIIKQWMEKIKDPTQRNGRSAICKEVYSRYLEKIVDEKVKSDLNLYGNYRQSYYDRMRLAFDYDLIKKTGESRIGYSMKVLTGLF